MPGTTAADGTLVASNASSAPDVTYRVNASARVLQGPQWLTQWFIDGPQWLLPLIVLVGGAVILLSIWAVHRNGGVDREMVQDVTANGLIAGTCFAVAHISKTMLSVPYWTDVGLAIAAGVVMFVAAPRLSSTLVKRSEHAVDD